jgi:hypothetical protein
VFLSRQPGRSADTEAAYRELASAGDPGALRVLAGLLRKLPGREAEAEATCREAAAAGDRYALPTLIMWLRHQPGRQAEANQLERFGLNAHGGTAETKSRRQGDRKDGECLDQA